ncbi:MAG: cytochrome c biogenesis protein CcsA [Bacteroidales bacterium]|nr:cytochrome c biogenesis protein CcsA [Bacteroidales bacterium]MCF8392010.1 cytochrome c biogenesis protein CcsA [Bacteroidales bacterium]
MKKILNTIFSPKATLVFLLIFAVGMGVATFIEEKFNIDTAKVMVYNAKWFEITMLMLALNFIGNIQRHNLFRWQKAGSLIFHIAFILLIVGAGITRYIGYEGNMHIREGQSSNAIFDSESNLLVKTYADGGEQIHSKAYRHSLRTKNRLKMNVKTQNEGNIQIKLRKYVRNAVERIEENVAGGKHIIELSVINGRQRESFYINEGERKQIADKTIVFGEITAQDDFSLSVNGDVVSIFPKHRIIKTDMGSGMAGELPLNESVELEKDLIYMTDQLAFSFNTLFKNAKKEIVSSNTPDGSPDLMILDVNINKKTYEAKVFGGQGYMLKYQDFNFDGTQMSMAYGNKIIELGFSLFLEDFNLERYPGSMSPSSFESDVVVIDPKNDIQLKHKIFMNNVLDYEGYRFFQSSYDKDEKGTILSVNHDFWGTSVTYFGYLLLALGFILTPFSRKSRIQAVLRHISDIRMERKSLLVALLLLGGGNLAFSQQTESNTIQAEHAAKFGELVSLSYDGRFIPVHSLANDVMHKISRKDEFETPGKAPMNARQVFLDMQIDIDYWQHQKIIYVREKSVREVLGIEGKHAAFSDFFNEQSKYKLQEFVDNAFRKQPSTQTKFDKEIIKVDERINICFMVFQGSMLKIFPDQISAGNKWLSWTDTLSVYPLSGPVLAINEDLQLPRLSYFSLYQKYLTELKKSKLSGDYLRTDQVLNYIGTVQRQLSPKNVLPSETKVNVEIFYNEANIFIKLKNIYGILSFVLIILAFIDNLSNKRSKFVTYPMYALIAILALGFLYHTFGMGLRWYLTEHAPWSNGYEALLLVAWSGLLAGFAFIRSSKLSLAATALFAFFALMTASHSSYDPQLTNLQPVLKSYWLIFHVATITISYGFLGLAFMLGGINMLLNLFQTPKNTKRVRLIIEELSSINELNMIIGLILATAGTFLGGIWANESWGRYWGWDAKETWSLIIIMTYTIILHTRFIPGWKKSFIINAGAIIGFGSVLMTFIGVNYYFTKGLHSYASGDAVIFPLWAWIFILSVIAIMVFAWKQDRKYSKLEE